MLGSLVVSFGVMLGLGMPVVFALGFASTVSLMWEGLLPLSVIPQRMIAQVDSFALMAVPFFVLAGELMERGGISTRLVKMISTLVGHFRGGLAMVCVLSSMVFAGLTGSSAADAAAIGSILIPAMIKRGYNAPFACSIQAAAATMGPIIPPSTLAIIYAAITNMSVAALFLAGFLPGFLMAAGLLVLGWMYSVRMDSVSEDRADWRTVLRAAWDASWALVVPFIILGGIVSGVFTATESGAVAAAYALFVGLFVHKELKATDLPDILVRSTVTTGMVMIVLATAGIFAWILVTQNVPQLVGDELLRVSRNPYFIMFLIIAFMLFIGCFMEIVAAGVIMIPVLAPIGRNSWDLTTSISRW